MSLNKYIQDQIEEIGKLNENTAYEGFTSISESETVPPHHHKYVLYNEYGYGKTGGPVADGNKGITSHEHLIMDFEVVKFGDGHIHKLEEADAKFGSDLEVGHTAYKVVATNSDTLKRGV